MDFSQLDYHFTKHVIPSKDYDYFVIPYANSTNTKKLTSGSSLTGAKEIYKNWAKEFYNDPIDNKNVFGMYLENENGIQFVKIRKCKHETYKGSKFEQLKYTDKKITSYFPCDTNIISHAIEKGKWKQLPVDDRSPINLESLLRK